MYYKLHKRVPIYIFSIWWRTKWSANLSLCAETCFFLVIWIFAELCFCQNIMPHVKMLSWSPKYGPELIKMCLFSLYNRSMQIYLFPKRPTPTCLGHPPSHCVGSVEQIDITSRWSRQIESLCWKSILKQLACQFETLRDCATTIQNEWYVIQLLFIFLTLNICVHNKFKTCPNVTCWGQVR